MNKRTYKIRTYPHIYDRTYHNIFNATNYIKIIYPELAY